LLLRNIALIYSKCERLLELDYTLAGVGGASLKSVIIKVFGMNAMIS